MSSSKKAAFVRQNLNRFRADANAEADRFVDIVNIGSDLDIVGSVNSFNPNLFASTRFHSQDMFGNVFQAYFSSNGTDPFTRISGWLWPGGEYFRLPRFRRTWPRWFGNRLGNERLHRSKRARDQQQ